jgi:origin recognition complex subunit 6
MGDYARAVICIEMATNALGQNFDLEIAYKLAGLKRSAYTNNKRTLEKILDLNKPIGINEICVKLGLNQVQQTAVDLLNKYKSSRRSQEVSDDDLDHPQYSAMAILFACKQHKLKPPKSKIMPLSHLRPGQWSILENVWEKWLQQMETTKKAMRVKNLNDTGEKMECDGDDDRVLLKPVDKPEVEEYEIWKERILRKAYKDIENSILKLKETASI